MLYVNLPRIQCTHSSLDCGEKLGHLFEDIFEFRPELHPCLPKQCSAMFQIMFTPTCTSINIERGWGNLIYKCPACHIKWAFCTNWSHGTKSTKNVVDSNTKEFQPVKLDFPLFSMSQWGMPRFLPSSMADFYHVTS